MFSTGAPLIAINALCEEGGDAPRLQLRTRYARAVVQAGGVPVVVPPVGGPTAIQRLLERVDGLLLPGGDDFDMERLGLGRTHPAAVKTPGEKQDFDVELARAALALSLPVLGICYGLQLLVLADGGRLYQHLPDDRPGTRDHRGGNQHDVLLAPGTKLTRLLGVERLAVISRHHQGIAGVGSAWTVAGRDDEGLIEAVEKADGFALGVQWHPELSPDGSPHERLFRGLVRAAGVHAARREHAPTPVPR